MWIKREYVLDYFENNFGDGFSVDNIKESCKSLSVYISPKLIEKWLLKRAEENGVDVVTANQDYQVKKVSELFDENLIKKMLKSFDEKKKLDNYKLNKIDYVLNIETLQIYANKCLQLCEVLEKLAGKIHLDNKTYDFFDFTIKDDEVLLSDVNRICIPLMKVYKYALSTCWMANSPATYLQKIVQPGVSYDSMLPSKELLFDSTLNPDEFVALTNKQKHEKFQKGL